MRCGQLSEARFQVVYPRGLRPRSSGVVNVLFAHISDIIYMHMHTPAHPPQVQ